MFAKYLDTTLLENQFIEITIICFTCCAIMGINVSLINW